MRDICKVIEQLKDVIPEERVNLRVRLDGISKGAIYHAPECRQQHWIDLSLLLKSQIGDADCEWKRTVGKIMRGEE